MVTHYLSPAASRRKLLLEHVLYPAIESSLSYSLPDSSNFARAADEMFAEVMKLDKPAGTGNNREVLRRYLDGQTRQLASRLGGPKTGDLVRLRAWLDAVAERRGVAEDLRLVPVGNRLNLRETPLSESQAAGAAHTIHAFRKALIHHDT